MGITRAKRQPPPFRPISRTPYYADVTTRPRAVIFALGALYLAQGIPFGFATEYLPVVLREGGASYGTIAAFGWLQLPWQVKILWAGAADRPAVRARSRHAILAMQLALTVTVASFAIAPLKDALPLWMALTFLGALFASTQDVLVDAFAVRVLRKEERGFGNTAQVAGYRLGMMVGGATLLLLVGSLGERLTLLACAAAVAAASIGAFVGSDEAIDDVAVGHEPAQPDAKTIIPLVKHIVHRDVITVAVIALTFKLGLHMAGALLKPMAVDYGWTKKQIGAAVVSVGAVSALAGAAVGGGLHRWMHEKRALIAALLFQALVCAPLIIVDRLHAPIGLTTFAIALEHFGSGLGTTVLFAALMTATRPANAGLQYTILQSLNALAIGVGSTIGLVLAGAIGKEATFAIATIVCVLPGFLLFRWDSAAQASRA
jgi:PAT family beta-lactamase induction signal transducer AmpG